MFQTRFLRSRTWRDRFINLISHIFNRISIDMIILQYLSKLFDLTLKTKYLLFQSQYLSCMWILKQHQQLLCFDSTCIFQSVNCFFVITSRG
ncbi:unnamed protein product [Paramecium octaurelia]|uniref:Uncharacterized protein n=1 Tax=Paramecium octaurelia TaxID=43137 RepID=A0A8S1SB41_PAROT|nr:unnamed protein product [Paramecium octaurelia]